MPGEPRIPISDTPVRTARSTSSGVNAASALMVTAGKDLLKVVTDGRQGFDPGGGHRDQIDPARPESFQRTNGGRGVFEIAHHNSCRSDEGFAGFAQNHSSADTVKSGTPSSRSNPAIACDGDGCAIMSASAAPSSTTAKKYFSCRASTRLLPRSESTCGRSHTALSAMWGSNGCTQSTCADQRDVCPPSRERVFGALSIALAAAGRRGLPPQRCRIGRINKRDRFLILDLGPRWRP